MSNIKEINISKNNISGLCDLKCAYNFKYNNSNLTATNNKIMIILSYDKSGIPSVIYNNAKYDVSQIMIVSPSKHLFEGNRLNGEIIIEHAPLTGGKNLFVSIPLFESSDSTTSSNMLSEIIMTVANKAPNNRETVNLNISDFSLQKIVPKKPFFTYTTGTKGIFDEWIVFGKSDAIPISNSILSKLSKIIEPTKTPALGGNVFYNEKGPNSFNLEGDDIYISCQPTGNSEEKTDVTTTKTNTSSSDLSMSDIINNPIAHFIFGCLIFIIILIVMNLSITYFSSGEFRSSLSSFRSKKS